MHFMRYERYFFLAALVLYVVAAWFSNGFYHGDVQSPMDGTPDDPVWRISHPGDP